MGEGGLFETRAVVDASSGLQSGPPTVDFEVQLYQLGSLVAYTTEVTFDGFKIFIIPPANLAGKTNTLDFGKMSYSELVAHFELEE